MHAAFTPAVAEAAGRRDLGLWGEAEAAAGAGARLEGRAAPSSKHARRDGPAAAPAGGLRNNAQRLCLSFAFRVAVLATILGSTLTTAADNPYLSATRRAQLEMVNQVCMYR